VRGWPKSSGGTITDDEAFGRVVAEMEADHRPAPIHPFDLPDAKANECAQTSRTPHAEKARHKAINDLTHHLSRSESRDIVEMLGGTIADMRRSAARIACIVDRLVQRERTRERLILNAERLRELGQDNMRASKLADGEGNARSSGALRGIAWTAFEASTEALRWASEVGQ
jgi:hypothetical protein